MGANLAEIDKVLSRVIFSPGQKRRVLDVGCQNLYLATLDQVVKFIGKWCDQYDPIKVAEYADLIAVGSEIDPVIGGLNGAWLGDVLSRAGFDYVSYDIFDGYNTLTFDLNRDSVKQEHVGAFDVVLNCGTTEHVIGQYNSFKVIHDATRVGGIMYHALPFTGYLDHGYFNYQPKLFFDLAKANGYQIIEASIGEPDGSEDAELKIIRPYLQMGVKLGEIGVSGWQANPVPIGGFGILLRKMVDSPFKVGLDTTTTAGAVKQTITGFYERSNGGGAGETVSEVVHTSESFQRDMLRRVNDSQLSYEEVQEFYRRFIEHFPGNEFRLELEKKWLVLGLERWPDKREIQARLSVVENLILEKYPLLKYVSENCDTSRANMLAGGIVGDESDIRAMPPGMERIDAIALRFKAYFDAGRITEFPLNLECEAIRGIIKQFGATADLKIRLGSLLSDLTKQFSLSVSP